MKSLSVRWRLTLGYAASLAVLLSLFGVLIHGLMSRSLLSRTDFELEEELQELALEVELAPSRELLLHQLDLRFSEHDTFEFQILDQNGHRWFASHRMAEVGIPAPQDFQGTSHHFRSVRLPTLGDCRVASRRVETREGPLVIQAILPLGRYLAELRDLQRLMLSVGPLMLLVAVGGGYWLARRALLPVDHMTTAAARITASQLDERLEVHNPHDELGHLAATFNQMLDRLQQAFDKLRQFTADAAHEFRTPLAVIRSTAEVALRTDRSTEHYQECLQSIAEETARLTTLSNELLVLSREDAGLAEGASETIELGGLIDQLVADLEPLLDDKSLDLHCDLPRDIFVRGDAPRLRRVFLNLLDNAIKFTPPCGHVSLQLTAHDDKAIVIVNDTGEGIPAEHHPRLFERFYRVDASRNRDTGGAGLGLAISRAIVERHGGRVRLSSRVGTGTTVLVELPLAPGGGGDEGHWDVGRMSRPRSTIAEAKEHCAEDVS